MLGVDLGGTNVRAGLVTQGGVVLERRARPTPRGPGSAGQLVDFLRSSLAELTGQLGVAGHAADAGATPPPSVRAAPAPGAGTGQDLLGVTGVVMGVPGSVDYQDQRVLVAPNLDREVVGALSADGLEAALGAPVELANDADLAAVGEATFGAGRTYRDVVYLTVSTGIGAGVVLGGRLVRGRRSAGEVGHTVLDACALRAGQPATLEELGAGPALERLARREGSNAGGAELARLALEGDARSAAILDEVAEAVALGVGNLALCFAPDVIVLGGGLGLAPGFFPRVVTALHALDRPAFDPAELAVVPSALGDDAGLAGTGAWATAAGTSVQPAHPARGAGRPSRCAL